MITAEIFSEHLKRLRNERLHHTQPKMVEYIGCSLSGYVKWENGMAIPSGEWIIKMLELWPLEFLEEFGINLARIRGGDKEEERKAEPKGTQGAFVAGAKFAIPKPKR